MVAMEVDPLLEEAQVDEWPSIQTRTLTGEPTLRSAEALFRGHMEDQALCSCRTSGQRDRLRSSGWS